MSSSQNAAWWQLLRAGNVLTAVSNILAGFLLVKGEWQPVLPLIFLALSSASLYLAGMILNDVFDLEIDRVERPERPLPSGRIELPIATVVGWGLMVDGISAAALAAWLIGSWLPLLMSLILAVTIVAYDAALKNSWAGPLAMGACRSLNVLLGASVIAHSADKNAAYFYALTIGVYTVGLTLLARKESGLSEESEIKLASNVIQLGVGLLVVLPALVAVPKFGWFALWIACFLIVRTHLYESYLEGTSSKVQQSVSRLIAMFIALDALVCVAAAGWTAGLAVLALLVPTYVATRHTPMT